MKIIGTGIDIVELKRIEKSTASGAFCRRVYTEAELSYADSRGRQRTASLAARWAGKEAILKALGTGLIGAMSLTDIEILPDEKGKPVASLGGATRDRARELGVTEVKLTLSHGMEHAVAECVLCGEAPRLMAEEKNNDGSEAVNSGLADGIQITADLTAGLLAKRPVNSHKGTVGRVLAVAGSYGYTGAAYLATLSALRAGAGLVTLAANKSIAPVMAVKCTEVMPRPVAESSECAGALGMRSYDEIMSLVENNDVVLIGPGLGRHPDTCALVQSLVVALGRMEGIQLVIDAEGLYALRGMSGLLKKCVNPAILTPHLGELAGLIGSSPAELMPEDGKIEKLAKVAGEKAREWNSVIVGKSHRTIVAAPDGRIFVTTTGNPGMATAGCGDVLAGAIAGIAGEAVCDGTKGVAVKSLAAALVGTHLHGLAGDMAGAKYGNGMIASDIIGCLPEARLMLEK